MIVFLDIDGTCADSAWRFKRAGGEPKLRGKEYSAWLAKVQNHEMLMQDKPVYGMKWLACALNDSVIAKVFYLTGRSEIYREVTKKWLTINEFPSCPLLMRPKGSRIPAEVLKEEVIKSLAFRLNEEIVVIDDDFTGRLQEVCKRNGWTFLKAMTGGYF